MPGTGIGGIFYVLLVVWLTLRETARSVAGKGDAARRASLYSLLALSAAIVGALWLEGLLLGEAFTNMAAAAEPGDPLSEAEIAAQSILPSLAAAPFVVLGLLVLAVSVARHVVPRLGEAVPAADASSSDSGGAETGH